MKRTSNLIDCPRCLGKGHVDLQDIKRLRRELFWEPGPHCAYCDGNKDLLWIAEKIEQPIFEIFPIVDNLLKHGLIVKID